MSPVRDYRAYAWPTETTFTGTGKEPYGALEEESSWTSGEKSLWPLLHAGEFSGNGLRYHHDADGPLGKTGPTSVASYKPRGERNWTWSIL